MTDADHPSLPAPPEQVALPPPVAVDRVRVARRWTVGILVVATVVLAGYLVLVLVAVWLVGAAFDAVTSREPGTLDVTGLLVAAVPGLFTGWCVGLVAASVLARGEALGARAAGLCSGVLGTLAGAVVLAITGVI